ncbi:polyprenyl synthetase family protein [Enteractinococcus coprophilus]|uniref:Geranylgeranyl diphosphate synthase type II n=1 Tax=Enteractinococcus coprophilus TaxID=1027633 RepID=A0A543APB3_9MICC|nr:polyprenyl synthetase family protein [Enteractinococcus coprophilus]TQL74412.1 geranylgeranyl diphosphate synthase type II [Enteractinococcus coprophilus]
MSIQAQLTPEAESDKIFAAAIDQRLTQLLDAQIQEAATPNMAELWRRVAGAMRGGKRTRPMLVKLGYQVVSTDADARCIEVGCAFELLHTALVIHDDIIDQDFIRRGQPTVSAHYRDAALAQGKAQAAAEHIGHAAALLAGDALIATAIQVLANACNQLAAGERIVEVFHTAIQHSAAGELDDVLFSAHLKSASLDDVLGMHRLKTAAYSFEAPLVAGALLAGASNDVVAQLSRFANLLGSSYQIIDDVLGTFGDAAQTGKPNDSDLREGKMTVLIALTESIDTAAPVVQGWRDGTVSNDAMRALFVTHDIETQARQLADECCEQAREQLAGLPVRAEVRTTFRHLIHDLLQRNH